MIADLEDFVTWVFCIVDDCCQGLAPLLRRPGPEPTTCSDSEVITVALVSECRGWKHGTQALAEWQAYRRLIPRLPERSRFNRRRRNLMQAINAIRRCLLATLDVAHDAHAAVDNLPLPVVSFHGAPQRSRDWDAHQARFGWCASKQQRFFGYRLQLLVTLGGVILDFALTPADLDEREGAEAMLAEQPGRTILADKGYVSEALRERLRATGVGRLIAFGLMTDAGRAVLPDLDVASFRIPDDILATLQADPEAWAYFQQFPAVYQRVRIGYIEEMRRQPDVFRQRLNHFLRKTRQGAMFGTLE